MDPKAQGDKGGEKDGANNGSINGKDKTNDNSQQQQQQPQQQQQQQQQQFPFGMWGMGGGMGGMTGQEMMEDIVSMAMGGGHPGGGMYPAYGPPPGGMIIHPPPGAMPPWMMSIGGNGASPGSSKTYQKKGKAMKAMSKKDEKQQQQSLAIRTSKRKRSNSTDAVCGNDTTEEPEVHIELMTDAWKKDVLEKFPRCKSAEGIRDTSYFATTSKGRTMVAGGGDAGRRYGSRVSASASTRAAVGGMSNINCLRKLLSELNRMEYEDQNQLPGGTAPIWLRYDDECPQYMRAIITGPPRDTPYSNGLFAFDIYVPDSYPQCSPMVQLLTTGGGTVRFGPNLYQNGKVCLSLIGTWSGPKWDPSRSSILQILISIQGLILGVEHPYYLEGYGGWEGGHSNDAVAMHHGAAASSAAAKSGAGGSGGQKYLPSRVRRYEDEIRLATMKYAIAEYCHNINRSRKSGATTTSRPNYLSAFEDIVQAHFWHRKECIQADAKKWVNMAQSQVQKRTMQAAQKGLESVLGQLENPSSATSEASAGTAAASLAASTLTAVDGKGLSTAGSAGGSSTTPEMAAKRQEMEAAAAKGDYITAGRIQSQLELSCKIHDLIASRKKEMDDAAEKKDYVEAGRLQLIVKHLERNRMRLQDLEKRMFEYASRQDFVKAGKFQEQYRVLMEAAQVDRASMPAGTSGAAAKAPPVGPGGLGGASAIGGGSGHSPMAFGGGYIMPGPVVKMIGSGADYDDDLFGETFPEDYADY